MLRSLTLALLGASSALAVTKCTLDSKCPQDAPCCSQYGECGVGAYCLGGCDPRMSFSLDSCMPEPVCEDKVMTFTDTKSIVPIDKYLGDPSQADWVSQGEPVSYDGSVLLTMPRESVGTVLASTRYMWYGNVKATLKTSHGAGVVTAFILLSDVKDEIDFEFVGTDLGTAQTNYYFQGITDYHNSANISGLSDTLNNFHEYELRWTPDQIEWFVDGKLGRTLMRKDTWNAQENQYRFPQTPARVQLSIWPGGAASNAKGTVDWAGGLIDWNSDDITKVGYYYTTFKEVSVECYKTSSPPGTNSGKGYTYTAVAATNDTVIDGDKDTTLASFQASGLNPEAGKPKPPASSGSSGSSSSTTASGAKNTQASIPGGSSFSGDNHSGSSSGSDDGKSSSGSNSIPGGGSPSSPGGSSGGSSSSSSSGSNSGSSGSSGGDSGSSGSGSAQCDTTSFNQDCGSNGDNSKASAQSSGVRESASSLAVLIFGIALYLL